MEALQYNKAKWKKKGQHIIIYYNLECPYYFTMYNNQMKANRITFLKNTEKGKIKHQTCPLS